MIRSFVGLAFLRWGIPGALCAVLVLVVVAWWLLTAFAWLVEGVFFGFGAFAGLGWLLLLIFLVRWLRQRKSAEHLMEYGRRGWLD